MLSVDDMSIADDKQIDWKRMKVGNCCLDEMERFDPLFELVVGITFYSSFLP